MAPSYRFSVLCVVLLGAAACVAGEDPPKVRNPTSPSRLGRAVTLLETEEKTELVGVLFTPAIVANLVLSVAEVRAKLQATSLTLKRLGDFMSTIDGLVGILRKKPALYLTESFSNAMVALGFNFENYRAELASDNGHSATLTNIVYYHSKHYRLQNIESHLKFDLQTLNVMQQEQTQRLLENLSREYARHEEVIKRHSNEMRTRATSVMQYMKDTVTGNGSHRAILRGPPQVLEQDVLTADHMRSFLAIVADTIGRSQTQRLAATQLFVETNDMLAALADRSSESDLRMQRTLKRVRAFLDGIVHTEVSASTIILGSAKDGSRSKFLGALGLLIHYLSPAGALFSPQERYHRLLSLTELLSKILTSIARLVVYNTSEDDVNVLSDTNIPKEIKQKAQAVREAFLKTSKMWIWLEEKFKSYDIQRILNENISEMEKDKEMCANGLTVSYVDCMDHQARAAKICSNTDWYFKVAVKFALLAENRDMAKLCRPDLNQYYSYLSDQLGRGHGLSNPLTYSFKDLNLDISEICRYWTWSMLLDKDSKFGPGRNRESVEGVVEWVLNNPPPVYPTVFLVDESEALVDGHQNDEVDNTRVLPEARGDGTCKVGSVDFSMHLKIYTTCSQAVFDASRHVLAMLDVTMKNGGIVFKDKALKEELSTHLRNLLLNIGSLNNCLAKKTLTAEVRALQSTSNELDEASSSVKDLLVEENLSKLFGFIANNVDSNSIDRDKSDTLSLKEYSQFLAARGTSVEVKPVGELISKLDVFLRDKRKTKRANKYYKDMMDHLSHIHSLYTYMLKFDRSRLVLRKSIQNLSTLRSESCIAQQSDADFLCGYYSTALSKTCEDTRWSYAVQDSLNSYGVPQESSGEGDGAGRFPTDDDLFKYSLDAFEHIQELLDDGVKVKQNMEVLGQDGLDSVVDEVLRDLNSEDDYH